MLVDGYFGSSERTAEENVWETVRQTDSQTGRHSSNGSRLRHDSRIER